MASTLMTPGVYIEEKNAFPSSAVAVETAVPVFIGYTEKASFKGSDLTGKPVRITSFAEYVERFGHGFVSKFDIRKVADEVAADSAELKKSKKDIRDGAAAHPENVIPVNGDKWFLSVQPNNTTYMYNSIRLFYANGGGPCYILAARTYGGASSIEIKTADFANDHNFALLEKEYEPTLVVMPDLIFNGPDAYSAYASVLAHCEKVQSRFGIFDLAKTTGSGSVETMDVVSEFRDKIGINALKYGAAYYPWLQTSIVQPSEVDLDNLVIEGGLLGFLPEKNAKDAYNQFVKSYNPGEYASLFNNDATLAGKVKAYHDAAAKLTDATAKSPQVPADIAKADGEVATALKELNDVALKFYPISEESRAAAVADAKAKLSAAEAVIAGLGSTPPTAAQTAGVESAKAKLAAVLGATPEQVKDSFYKALKAVSPTYVAALEKARLILNELPPSAAMAGIYTMVDNTRGVWKAPANVSVNMVNKPSMNVSHEGQERLNVDVLAGKSINVIRAFPGIGTLVWGGRTLDGNSLDWRYINVRRTLIMIEQSLKMATRAYVFEPNDANTWVTVKSMITNFLTNLWKQGALAGAAPEQAFDVQIGLGSTMTATDILEGKMLISVKVAIVRPAEFIVITFEQQLQQS